MGLHPTTVSNCCTSRRSLDVFSPHKCSHHDKHSSIQIVLEDSLTTLSRVFLLLHCGGNNVYSSHSLGLEAAWTNSSTDKVRYRSCWCIRRQSIKCDVKLTFNAWQWDSNGYVSSFRGVIRSEPPGIYPATHWLFCI